MISFEAGRIHDPRIHAPRKPRGVRVSKPPTLHRYGLSRRDFLLLGESQKWCCGCCGRSLVGIIIHIDHEHIAGWKKLRPEERRWTVRGLLCFVCNALIPGRAPRTMTIEIARAIVKYLVQYRDGDVGRVLL